MCIFLFIRRAVFPREDITAIINFSAIAMQRLFEGGAYSRAAFNFVTSSHVFVVQYILVHPGPRFLNFICSRSDASNHNLREIFFMLQRKINTMKSYILNRRVH